MPVFYQIEKIIDSRKPIGKAIQYLIKWKHFQESSWQPITNLQNAMEMVTQYQMQKKSITKSQNSEMINQKNTIKTTELLKNLSSKQASVFDLKRPRQIETLLIVDDDENNTKQLDSIKKKNKMKLNLPNSSKVKKIYFKSKNQNGQYIYAVIYNNEQKIFLTSSKLRQKHPQQFLNFLEQDLLDRIKTNDSQIL